MNKIEQELLVQGITQEELQRYTQLLRINGKGEDLRYIANAHDWEAIPEGFLKVLTETLGETGMTLERFSPRTQSNRDMYRSRGRRAYLLGVAELVADGMFKTLTRNSAGYRYNPAFTLDKLFQDTFESDGAEK